MSTNYVQTRWYRAPELLLDNEFVSKETDMWSVGCIFAELLNRDVLFKGSNPTDQLKKIINKLGKPDISEVRGSANGIEFIKQIPKPNVTLSWNYIVPTATPLAVDLLKRILTFNHEKRISAEEALYHPYFASIFDPETVISCPSKFDTSYEDFFPQSNKSAENGTIKRECYETIMSYLYGSPQITTVNSSTSDSPDQQMDDDEVMDQSTFYYQQQPQEKLDAIQLERDRVGIFQKVKNFLASSKQVV